MSSRLPHPLQTAPPPTSTSGVPESSSRKLSCPRRSRSMRRSTTEIQTTGLPDPQYQRDTVESTQTGLDQDYNSLYNLVKVREGQHGRCSLEESQLWLKIIKYQIIRFRFVVLVLCFQMKTRRLEETLRLHRFYNSCQEFESWMEDKENILDTFSTDADNLGVVQAKYEVKILHYMVQKT